MPWSVTPSTPAFWPGFLAPQLRSPRCAGSSVLSWYSSCSGPSYAWRSSGCALNLGRRMPPMPIRPPPSSHTFSNSTLSWNPGPRSTSRDDRGTKSSELQPAVLSLLSMEFHRNSVRAIWTAFVVISSQLVHAQVDTSSATFHRIDAYLAQQTAQGTFRGSVLIGINGHVAFEKGYGLANEEWSAANTPATKFRIASLTKQFTGACILLLQERGQLIVHDPISKYVPDLPSAWQPITLHQLLTHTSGIPNFTEKPQADSTLNRIGVTPRQTLGLVAA